MIFIISQVERKYLIILERFWRNSNRKGTLGRPWFLLYNDCQDKQNTQEKQQSIIWHRNKEMDFVELY